MEEARNAYNTVVGKLPENQLHTWKTKEMEGY
jgi:hypothetical protein